MALHHQWVRLLPPSLPPTNGRNSTRLHRFLFLPLLLWIEDYKKQFHHSNLIPTPKQFNVIIITTIIHLKFKFIQQRSFMGLFQSPQHARGFSYICGIYAVNISHGWLRTCAEWSKRWWGLFLHPDWTFDVLHWIIGYLMVSSLLSFFCLIFSHPHYSTLYKMSCY